MLRSNLSTRPFYNERLVHLLIGLGAAVVLAITVLDVGRLIALSRQNTALSRDIDRDRSEAQRLATDAATVRKGVDPKELAGVAAAAREANVLIDQRTFSWTAFFNHIEETLPPDVMLTSVRPTVDGTGARVSMTVVGRMSEDIDEFIDRLEATGLFEDILPRQQDRTDDGLQRSLVDARYVPAAETERAPEAPATASSAAAGGRP
jgi:Tfp pilus assembly protein PilN